MRQREQQRHGLPALLLALAVMLLPGPPARATDAFADPAFRAVWERTDAPVAAGQVARSWWWGPAPGAVQREPYAEAAGGVRLVQYFDKSRMEINRPGDDPSRPFYVTNGRLAVELISGRIAVGDGSYVQAAPATMPMTGDPGDLLAPTYAAFAAVSNTPAGDHRQSDRTGQYVVQTIDHAGRVLTATTSQPPILLAHYVPETGHNIAAPFWLFLTQSGPVQVGDRLTTAPLAYPWYYAAGLPISEPYWAKQRVGGKIGDVLIQAFERRVLTYSPANPPGLQIEMGNIGQHYYAWRYPASRPTPTATPAPAPTSTPFQISGPPVSLAGGGATPPSPIYMQWFQLYSSRYDPNLTFTYQPVGTGAGRQLIFSHNVDFAGADWPLNSADRQARPGLLQVPILAGAVVVAYNLPGFTGDLVLDGPVLARIYLGQITRWNDPAIQALNPGVYFPRTEIVVVHASDGAGRNYIFTDYLSHVSAEWQQRVGTGPAVNWPVGLGGRGDAGYRGLIAQTSYSIGYLEWTVAQNERLPLIRMKNRAGQIVAVSQAGVAAAAGADLTQSDSIVDAAAPAAWPLAGFTYILLYQDQADARRGSALARFLWWAVHDTHAAEIAAPRFYAPLPAARLPGVETELRRINIQGRSLLPP